MNRQEYVVISVIIGILVILAVGYAVWFFFIRKKPANSEGYSRLDFPHRRVFGCPGHKTENMGSVGEVFNNEYYWKTLNSNCPNYGCGANKATLPCAPRFMRIGDKCCKCHKPKEECRCDKDKKGHSHDNHDHHSSHEDPYERYNERVEAGNHKGFDPNSFNGIPHKEKSHCGECDKCELCQVDFNNIPRENCKKKCDGISPTLRGMGEYEYVEDYEHHKNECFPPKVRLPNMVIDYNKEEMVCRYSDVSLRRSVDYKRIRIENNSTTPIYVGINTCDKTKPEPCFLLEGGEIKDLGVNPPGCPDQYIWLLCPRKVCDCDDPCECEMKLEVVNTPHVMPGFANQFVLLKGENIWFIKDMNQPM